MLPRQKRACAIHDISCFGRCSLTVALPILSAAGIETAVLPTAVLSTHTGGFTGYTYRDLTCDITPIADHWKSLDIRFDALYSGFLGSFEQIELVKKLFDDFGSEGTVKLVDPAMADYGKMYPIFDMAFAGGMAELCKKADIIIPNITEAVFMLGEEYTDGPYTEDYILGLCRRLAALCSGGKVVLTGVYFDGSELGAAAYDAATDRIDYLLNERIPGLYHGSGDVFASAMLAAYMNGKSLAESTRIAVKYTVTALLRSHEEGTETRCGIDFEGSVPVLLRELGKI